MRESGNENVNRMPEGEEEEEEEEEEDHGNLDSDAKKKKDDFFLFFFFFQFSSGVICEVPHWLQLAAVLK